MVRMIGLTKSGLSFVTDVEARPIPTSTGHLEEKACCLLEYTNSKLVAPQGEATQPVSQSATVHRGAACASEGAAVWGEAWPAGETESAPNEAAAGIGRTGMLAPLPRPPASADTATACGLMAPPAAPPTESVSGNAAMKKRARQPEQSTAQAACSGQGRPASGAGSSMPLADADAGLLLSSEVLHDTDMMADAEALQAISMTRCDSNISNVSARSDSERERPARDKPAPFLTKLIQILETNEYAPIVRWSEHASSAESAPSPAFSIVDTVAFSKSVLPQFFKHNKLSSFVQQLYTYGFRRCADTVLPKRAAKPDAPPPLQLSPSSEGGLTFQHDLFRPGAPELLRQIKRGGMGRDCIASAASPALPVRCAAHCCAAASPPAHSPSSSRRLSASA